MLRSSDHKALLELIDCLYAIPDRTALIRTLCERLQRLIPFSSAVFLPKDLQTDRFMVDGRFVLNSSDRAYLAYISHYAAVDPFAINNWLTTSVNEVARYTDFVPVSSLAESEFGRDFMPLVPMFYAAAMTLGCQGDPVGAIGLHRQKGDRNFSDREIEIMRRLVPHLSRAIHLIELTRVWETVSAGGVITVREGRAVERDGPAQEALDGMPLGSIPDPGLDPAARFVRSRSGTFRVRTVDGPDRERRILLQAVPRGSPRDIRARYGLSARQAEITRLVLRGLSNRAIGDRLCITEQTVKDHLREVFGKLGVSRRSELTAKVLGLCDVS